MLRRLPYSYESLIKIVLLIVLAVLLLNIYILSLIFSSEGTNYKRPKSINKDHEVKIKEEPLKKIRDIHDGKHAPKKAIFMQTNTTELATKKILQHVELLQRQFVGKLFSDKKKRTYQTLLDDLKISKPTSSDFLQDSMKWVNGRQLYPERTVPPLGQILNSLHVSHIERADVMPLGTQLKILLTLEGGLRAVFKPQWYPRTEVITGSVYAGKDRHNGEIAAFHFSWLLGLRRVPLTVGRKINLHKEIMSVASSDLLKTFYQEGNNTCFYGECLYCSPETGVCANQDVLEGALILWLPEDLPLKKFRHPWQRTYRDNIPARWELDAGYCQVVRKAETYSRGPRLLDIIDTAIFDFILGNGDRHHYEVFKNINSSAVLLIDNGKSFGNPYVDHIDILAPLYQCCRLRSTTYTRLLWLQTMSVGDTLRDMLQWSQISPVLTDEHFPALDRRVLKVIAAVHVCFKERNGKQNVIVDD